MQFSSQLRPFLISPRVSFERILPTYVRFFKSAIGSTGTVTEGEKGPILHRPCSPFLLYFNICSSQANYAPFLFYLVSRLREYRLLTFVFFKSAIGSTGTVTQGEKGPILHRPCSSFLLNFNICSPKANYAPLYFTSCLVQRNITDFLFSFFGDWINGSRDGGREGANPDRNMLSLLLCLNMCSSEANYALFVFKGALCA